MKRLQTHTRAVLLAVLVGMVGMLAFQASPASAAPTLPPIIDDTPSDPNTVGPASFTVSPNPAETANVTELRCRVASAKPSGFNICWTSNPDDRFDGTWIPQNMVNGPAVFQTQAYDGSLGPIATYNWTQNTPAPTQAPVFTEVPDSPNTVMPAHFAFEPGAGDEGKVNGFECRIDSNDPAKWVPCNLPLLNYGASQWDYGIHDVDAVWAGTGTHTMDVRARTGDDVTPFVSHTWTNDAPSVINPNVKVSDADLTTWNGEPDNRFGNSPDTGNSVQNAGDINDDGLDDLLAGSNSGMNEALVLYSTAHGLGSQSIGSSLPASRGYAMRSAQGVSSYDTIGDQNGDGVPDFVVPFGFGPLTAVVYGVADATSLPKCDGVGPTQKRCIDLDDLDTGPDGQGYYLNTGFGSAPGSAGDFDGDGKDDFQISSFATANTVFVKGGTARTGTVDPAALAADQKFTATAPPGFYGTTPSELGDLNGDGKGDFSNGDPFLGSTWIIYGRAFGSAELNLGTGFNENEGMLVATQVFAFPLMHNVGDVNGDGRPDLSASGLVDSLTSVGAILPVMYTPEQPTTEPILPEGQASPGYTYNDQNGDAATGFGKLSENAGDVNNDGVPDMLSGAPNVDDGSDYQSGAGYLLFGQRPGPESPLIGISSELTPQTGVAIFGEGQRDSFGSGATPLGDVTGDGITDFAIAKAGVQAGDASPEEHAGAVYIVSGGKILASAKTGAVTDIMKTSATLNASVTTSGRDTEVVFESGTTDAYGETSAPIQVEGSNTGTPVSLELNGLEGTTEYHYRTVTTNSLGLTYYGDDQTFTTNDDDGPFVPVNPCDTDPGAAGCAGFCAAHNTAIGCPGYDVCAAQPNKCSGGKTKAKIGLITSPKTIKVKRGKKGSVSAIVYNSGGKQAKNVKVCVKAPKKFIKVKKCQTFGSIGSGATKTKQFKVKVKKKAKKGKKITLKFTATSGNAGKKTAKAKVVVKK